MGSFSAVHQNTSPILDRKEHQVRKWNGCAYTYTRLGKQYFDSNPAKWIVEVPVRIEGRRGAGRDHRRDGEAYERRAVMPVSHFELGEIRLSEQLTTSEKMLRIKKLVLDSVGANAGDAEILLHQESNERWLLDPVTDWRFSKLEVIEHENGPSTTEAVMHKPMHQLMHRPLAGTPWLIHFCHVPSVSSRRPGGGELYPQTARRSPPASLV